MTQLHALARVTQQHWLAVVSGVVAALVVVPLVAAAGFGYAERTQTWAANEVAHAAALTELHRYETATKRLADAAQRQPELEAARQLGTDADAFLDASLRNVVADRAGELDALLSAPRIHDSVSPTATPAGISDPRFNRGAEQLREDTAAMDRAGADLRAKTADREAAIDELVAAQTRLRDVMTALGKSVRASAQGVLGSAPIADQTSKDALEASLKAIEGALPSGTSWADAFAGYASAAKAVSASHAATVAAAKAAEDAARNAHAGRSGAGSSGGSSTGSGTGTGTGTGGTGGATGGGSVACSTQHSSRVLQLVNQARSEHGAAPLALHAALQQAACDHSSDQAAHNTMSHTGSNGSTMSQRISAAGYNWSTCGENVAAGYGSPESVFNGWMNSPGHRANILNPNYRHMGLGTAQSAGDTLYWTQTFGG
ncbi:MAG TPA: CAP domain-containing protein [Candidatus Lumbricidophila sp.]|nr:CAP domain-containing protein [Candidatus Lumbricidophila sp.]